MSMLLSVRGLNVAFGANAVVRDLGFELEAGETLRVACPDGAPPPPR